MAESDSEGSVDFIVGGFSREWEDLTEAQRAAATVLGGGGGAWPPVGRQWPAWGDLTPEQREAAALLDETLDAESWPPQCEDSDSDSYEGFEIEDSDDDDDHAFAESAEDAASAAKRRREVRGRRAAAGWVGTRFPQPQGAELLTWLPLRRRKVMRPRAVRSPLCRSMGAPTRLQR
jgi:hypothetical protein